MNMFVQVWANAIAEEVPEARPRAYADDISATADHPRHIRAVVRVTQEFARLTGMTVNARKSHVWATSLQFRIAMRDIQIDGETIPRQGRKASLVLSCPTVIGGLARHCQRLLGNVAHCAR